MGSSNAFRRVLFSEYRTDDGHLVNPFSCASLISFPVCRGVALPLVGTQAESVNKNSGFHMAESPRLLKYKIQHSVKLTHTLSDT